MKNVNLTISFIILLSLITLPLNGQMDKEINLLGNVGFAISDLEGLFFDLGAEMEISEKLYGQILFDYYPSPGGGSTSAYGLNLFGVYKLKSSENLNFFAKAGIHMTTISFSATIYGENWTGRDTDFGVAGGGGVEYILKDKISLVAGGTVKLIFAEGDTGTWFKIYGGVKYKLR